MSQTVDNILLKNSQQEGVPGPVTIYKDFILSYQQLCEVGSMILFYR